MTNDSKRDEQRAVYAELLMSLARQAPPDRLSILCDRIERTLAACGDAPVYRRSRLRRRVGLPASVATRMRRDPRG